MVSDATAANGLFGTAGTKMKVLNPLLVRSAQKLWNFKCQSFPRMPLCRSFNFALTLAVPGLNSPAELALSLSRSPTLFKPSAVLALRLVESERLHIFSRSHTFKKLQLGELVQSAAVKLWNFKCQSFPPSLLATPLLWPVLTLL